MSKKDSLRKKKMLRRKLNELLQAPPLLLVRLKAADELSASLMYLLNPQRPPDAESVRRKRRLLSDKWRIRDAVHLEAELENPWE